MGSSTELRSNKIQNNNAGHFPDSCFIEKNISYYHMTTVKKTYRTMEMIIDSEKDKETEMTRNRLSDKLKHPKQFEKGRGGGGRVKRRGEGGREGGMGEGN